MENQLNSKPIVLWVIWSFMFIAILMYQFLLAGGIPSGKNKSDPTSIFMWIIWIEVFATCFIRWVLMQNQKETSKLLVLMIVGLSLAESMQFIQIFIIGNNFPETQLTVFIISIISALQFMPTYAINHNSKDFHNYKK